MVFFTSDLHFGHEKIIEHCGRPFSSVEEMDRIMIENWNRKVRKNDKVYIIGDIVWNKDRVGYYMEQLSGKKYLIVGNHDTTWPKREENKKYFADILQYMEGSFNGHRVTLCHYPMLEWAESRNDDRKHLGFHIHGHIHNRISKEYIPLFRKVNALNAGVDINGFSPVTFDELIENNNRFKLACLESQEDREYLLREINNVAG